MYYSTGKGTYLPQRGMPVGCTNETTVKILLNGGYLVKTLEELVEVKAEPIVEKQAIQEEVKPKRKGNPNWAKKN